MSFAGIGFVGTLVLTFSLPQIHSSMQILVMVTLLQIISSTSQTALGVTQFALATEMTETPIGLSKLLSLAVVLSQILSVVFSILAPLLVAWSGGGSAGYSRMAAEMAALTGVALLGFMLVTRAVLVGKRSAASEAMPTWAALRATLSNRPFYFLIAFVLFTNTSVAILFGFLPFANQYVLGGNASGLSMLEGVLGVTVLLGMLLAPEFVRRLDAVVSMRICNLVVAGMSGLLFVASLGPIWTTWAVLAGAAWQPVHRRTGSDGDAHCHWPRIEKVRGSLHGLLSRHHAIGHEDRQLTGRLRLGAATRTGRIRFRQCAAVSHHTSVAARRLYLGPRGVHPDRRRVSPTRASAYCAACHHQHSRRCADRAQSGSALTVDTLKRLFNPIHFRWT